MDSIAALGSLGSAYISVAIGGSTLVYTCTLVIYRLYFHPIARFPGPKLAAATKWYEAYFDLVKRPGGQYSKEINKMHERYGPIVRINPDELHIRDSGFYDTVYSGKRDKWPPAALMIGTDLSSTGTVDHFLHRKRRAMNAPLMGKQVVVEAMPKLRQQLAKLRNAFVVASQTDQPIELGVTFLAFTFDVVSSYLFQEPIGLQDDPVKALRWQRAFHQIALNTPLAKQFPWLVKWVMELPPYFFDTLDPLMASILEFYAEIRMKAEAFVKNYDKSAEDSMMKTKQGRPSTLFHAVFEADAPAEEKSIARLQHNSIEFVLAGSETTAKVLKRAVYDLTTNGDIVTRLRAEIKEAERKSAKSLDDFTLTEMERLPLLTGVVKESLRISTLVTSRLPVMPHTPLPYKDWVIPAMTPVSLTPADVLRDKSIFPEPDSFQPDRWLDKSEDGTLKPHVRLERYLVIFGKGGRMCQGLNLAYAELYLALSMLVMGFDFDVSEVVKERDIDFVADCFLGEVDASSPGVRVRVRQVQVELESSKP